MMDGFKKSIGGLKGAKVRFFFKDSQFIDGILIAVKQDHLVVNLDEHVFYFALKNIYGISQKVKDTQVSKQTPLYIDKNYLTDVLNSIKYNYITINGLSKEIYDGVLMSILEDCIVIVNNTGIHFINYSKINVVIDGVFEHTVKQGDDIQEQITNAQQNTEQTLETAAISIQSSLEPTQDKIVASSFLEKIPSQTAEMMDIESQLEKKEANLSDTKEVSEEKTPTSSHVEKMTETEDEKNKGEVVFESNEVTLSDIKEDMLSSGEENLSMGSFEDNQKVLKADKYRK